MSAKCQEHYPAEMDEAINAGACPVCLRRELAEARKLLREAREDVEYHYDYAEIEDCIGEQTECTERLDRIDAFLERKP